jgi:hypothetical protein
VTLVDVRRVAVRQQMRIRFAMRGGLECVVGEDGVARVPGLRGTPDFNLEQELAEAGGFVLEPAREGRGAGKRSLGRQELAVLAGTPAGERTESHEDGTY